MSKMLSKIAKLDINLSFVCYIRSQTVKMCKPILLDKKDPYVK